MKTPPKKRNAGRFAPGTSGNPSGRPPGSRNKSTLLLQELLAEDGDSVVRRTVELAKKGNISAIKLILDRLLPPVRERPIQLPLREPFRPGHLPITHQDVMLGLARGDLTPREGQALVAIIESAARQLPLNMFQRLDYLEKEIQPPKKDP